MKIKVTTRFLILAVFLALSSIYTTYYGFFKMTVKLNDISTTNLLEEGQPWFPKRKKLIFLLIDALRFDYLPTDVTMNNVDDYKEIFHGQMQRLQKKLLSEPKNSQILKIKADPPTWTINRIPSINTGNIPPAANILQFMGASPLEEDNFVQQAHLAGLKSYFIGDPVWMEYSPNLFTRAIDVHPFDIKDFAVDDTTIRTMKEWIKEDTFDFILAHCLGVDHAGHDLGIFDPEVPKQIRKMDEFVTDLMDMIDDDTILFITGDHGMTPTGSHGYETYEEETTALLAYSKKGFQKNHEKDLSSIMKSIRDKDESAMQVDLAATVSMLLGLPIPYSSLGTIINDVYPVEEEQKAAGAGTHDCAGNGNLFMNRLVRDNYLNSLQLKEYFDSYQELTRAFPGHMVHEIKRTIHKIKVGYETFMEMQENPKECKANYRDVGKQMILEVKKLSEIIHDFTLNNNTYDMSIIIQSIITLTFVACLYIFLVQFDHKTKSIDNCSFRKLGPLVLIKPIVFPIILSIMIVVLWAVKRRYVYPLASVSMTIAIWAVVEIGYLLAKRRLCNDNKTLLSTTTSVKSINAAAPIEGNKPVENVNQVKQENQENHTSLEMDIMTAKNQVVEDNELIIPKGVENETGSTLNFKKFPLLSQPLGAKFLVSAATLATCCLVMTQSSLLEDNIYEMYTTRAQYYLLALAALRALLFDRANKTNLLVLLTSSICLSSTHAGYDLLTAKIAIAFVFLLDHLYHERQYLHKEWTNKNMKKAFLFDLSIVCTHALLLGYHVTNGNHTEEREILIPRILWGLMFFTAFLTFAFRMPAKSRKVGLQMVFVLLLTLFQHSDMVINVVFVLYLFKTVTDLWAKKFSAFNYIYVMLIAFLSHIGFFLTDHTDRRIPVGFTLGFIGLHDFNPVLSILMIVLNYLTAFLLAYVFISYYIRKLENKGQDEKVMNSELESEARESEIRLIQRSNAILFVFFFSVVYFGAVIKCVSWKDWNLVGAIEKFLVDAFLYVFMMIASFTLI